jgi:hypothetical protein
MNEICIPRKVAPIESKPASAAFAELRPEGLVERLSIGTLETRGGPRGGAQAELRLTRPTVTARLRTGEADLDGAKTRPSRANALAAEPR